MQHVLNALAVKHACLRKSIISLYYASGKDPHYIAYIILDLMLCLISVFLIALEDGAICVIPDPPGGYHFVEGCSNI